MNDVLYYVVTVTDPTTKHLVHRRYYRRYSNAVDRKNWWRWKYPHLIVDCDGHMYPKGTNR